MTDNDLFLVDIGANLSHSSFQADLHQVISNAKAAGVGHIIVTGSDLESIESAQLMVSEFPDYLTLTAGFHPHTASTFDEFAFQKVREFARLPEVVAVGETGLDFNRNFSTPKEQEAAFIQQLELAGEVNKPVFLHQRDAHDRFLSILKDYRSQLPSGVVHCFTDTREALYEYLDLDMYIGITGWICDERRGLALQDLVADIPSDRLLLETDAPYLLPRSIQPAPKTRRNEPRYLIEVLKTLSHCTGRTVEAIATETADNAQSLFKLDLNKG